MPTKEQNLTAWNQTYPWPQQGEEWSSTWGGSEAQWFFVIYPRIHLFIPAKTILEIAPGYGRWTDYLRNYCQRLVGVDLSPSCIEACKRRFASLSDASFHVNDGYSLAMIPDESVDFAFSFDSLVHAENDVIAAYLEQLSKILAANVVLPLFIIRTWEHTVTRRRRSSREAWKTRTGGRPACRQKGSPNNARRSVCIASAKRS